MLKTQIPQKTKSAKIEVIYLGIDVHTEKQVLVRQMGADTPQPAQRFNREKLINWIAQQLELAEEVYTCYEAGPFGYGLYINSLFLYLMYRCWFFELCPSQRTG